MKASCWVWVTLLTSPISTLKLHLFYLQVNTYSVSNPSSTVHISLSALARYICTICISQNFMYYKTTLISLLPSDHLPTTISPVYHNVRSRGESAGVARKVQKYSLQLFRITLASHWREAQPFLFPSLGYSGRYRSLDVARRNCIHASKACPLYCKGLCKMNYSGFGRIIAGLKIIVRVSEAAIAEADVKPGTYLTLWDICYVARHGCCED